MGNIKIQTDRETRPRGAGSASVPGAGCTDPEGERGTRSHDEATSAPSKVSQVWAATHTCQWWDHRHSQAPGLYPGAEEVGLAHKMWKKALFLPDLGCWSTHLM